MANVVDETEGVNDVDMTEKLETFPGLYRATTMKKNSLCDE